MLTVVAGFARDEVNSLKRLKHGVTTEVIERLFRSTSLRVEPDILNSMEETRFRAFGRTETGRAVFVVFTLRIRDGRILIRPISARYLHRKEIESYEKENPRVQVGRRKRLLSTRQI